MIAAEDSDLTLTREQMHAHAQAWISAWNRRDVEAGSPPSPTMRASAAPSPCR